MNSTLAELGAEGGSLRWWAAEPSSTASLLALVALLSTAVVAAAGMVILSSPSPSPPSMSRRSGLSDAAAATTPSRPIISSESKTPATHGTQRNAGKAATPASEDDNGPWFLPCRTAHARRFPRRHAFSYSYLQVAFRVGCRGNYGRTLSLDQDDNGDDIYAADGGSGSDGGARRVSKRKWTWFSVSDADYLFRGNGGGGGLRAKLDEYLASEGVDMSKVRDAYLVTAPRFLGYAFNPVSFWYLYDGAGTLSHMILEVNNTFDERRMYLLPRGGEGGNNEEQAGGGEDDGEEEDGPTKRDGGGGKEQRPFRQTWPKDFHVSPFSSRKGSYSLVAREPRWWRAGSLSSPHKRAGPAVDNTITLISSKAHAKLVARLQSTGPAVSVQSLTSSRPALMRFVVAWWWVGFVTFPRILWEAARLFFRRKLHVWFRPEVEATSVGRQATARELAVGAVFARFVRRRAADHNVRLRLTGAVPGADAPYGHEPSHHHGGDQTAPEGDPTDRQDEDAGHDLHLHVTSPAFFALYAGDANYVQSGIALPPMQRPFVLSGRQGACAETLAAMFPSMATTTNKGKAVHPMDDFARGMADGDQGDDDDNDAPEGGKEGKEGREDERRALQHEANAYARAVRALRLADAVALGSAELLDAMLWGLAVTAGAGLLWWGSAATAGTGLLLW